MVCDFIADESFYNEVRRTLYLEEEPELSGAFDLKWDVLLTILYCWYFLQTRVYALPGRIHAHRLKELSTISEYKADDFFL